MNNLCKRDLHLFFLKGMILSLLVVILFSYASVSVFANSESDIPDITLFIDNAYIELDQPPVLLNGNTMVPLRVIGEKFGYEIKWNPHDKSATISNASNIVVVKINDKNAVVNSQIIQMTQAPVIIEGSTFVPLRFIAQSFGKEVLWDGVNRRVIIGQYDKALVEKNAPKSIQKQTYYITRIGKSYGVIDKDGHVLISDFEHMITAFNEGMAIYMRVDSGYPYYYAIDVHNRSMDFGKFTELRAFHEGLAVFADNETLTKKKYGVVDKQGKKIVNASYSYIFDYKEGMAKFAVGDYAPYIKTDAKFGFLNLSGKEAVAAKYDGARDFVEGRAVVKMGEKFGVIDKSGKELTPIKYSHISDFSNKIAVARDAQTQRYLILANDGRELTAPKYDLISNFSKGVAFYLLRDDHNALKLGFINASGKELTPAKYDGIKAHLLMKDHAKGIYEDSLQNFLFGIGIVSAKEFDEGGAFISFSEGLVAVRSYDQKARDEKWAFVDTKGIEKLPFQYEAVGEFKSGVCEISTNGMVFSRNNIIDKSGRTLINKKYEAIDNFGNGLIRYFSRENVGVNGKYGLLNTKGEEITTNKYNDIQMMSNQLLAFKVDKFWGIIGSDGKELIPARFDAVKDLSEQAIMFKTLNKWGVIDKSGKIVLEANYDELKLVK